MLLQRDHRFVNGVEEDAFLFQVDNVVEVATGMVGLIPTWGGKDVDAIWTAENVRGERTVRCVRRWRGAEVINLRAGLAELCGQVKCSFAAFSLIRVRVVRTFTLFVFPGHPA